MNIRKSPLMVSVIIMAVAAPVYAAPASTSSLSDQETQDLTFMREEEKLARDTYLTLFDVWGLDVFSNIASSEQMHMNAILTLLNKYDLPDPAAGKGIGEFTNTTLQDLYDTLIARGKTSGLDGLKVGGTIEEKDMVDLQAAIDRSQHADIDNTYETLMCGSRNHLRSFAQNIEALTGEPYVAQILTQDQVDAILSTSMEKCGKSRSSSSTSSNTGRVCQGKCLGWSK